jgi:molybdopterin adenylyltransferase
MNHPDGLDPVRIGLVSVSDRAASGVYADEGIPALKSWLNSALRNPLEWREALIPDEQARIREALLELVDEAGCDLVFTTGGTGPARRDVTPDATLAVAERELPGFAEQMRQVSLRFVPTAILSRQVAVTRGRALIVNLPGQPKAIAETLGGFPGPDRPVQGIFAAIPYCVQLLEGPYLETDPDICAAFRPKSARRRID